MSIDYLDGRRFRRVLVAGADWVRHRRDHLDAINVFPVADGDTGTNMALSLAATAAAIKVHEERHLGVVVTQAAEACIVGAKGNSGVILAHWFLGLSRVLGDQPRVGPAALAAALGAATQAVYQALERPVEGTIVTVMRAVSEHAERSAGARDLRVMLDGIVGTARVALAATTEQLEALRQAQVVDAGAQGYAEFLEGAARAVRGEPLPAVTAVAGTAVAGTAAAGTAAAGTAAAAAEMVVAHAPGDADGEVAERYCTEVVVRGRGFDEAHLRRAFRDMGSALLVATTGSVFKLHVHTDHPGAVLREAARRGAIVERKVDDMLRQRDERAGPAIGPAVPLARQPGGVAVVSDSSADLPADLRRALGIEMAPLQVLFGDRVYRDQVDLDTETFYRLLQSDPSHPSTSQPPPRAFVEALDRLRVDREVLIITLGAALSGTYRSALAGARLAAQPRVEVYDSGSVSLGLGLMASNAARLAARGVDLDGITLWLDRWRAGTGLVFTLSTLEYLRRGGRIGAAKGVIGRLLGVRPVLTLGAAGVEPLDTARGEPEAFEKVAGALEQRLHEGERVRLGLIDVGESGPLDRLERRLRARCEVVECIRGVPTGVIGAHAGPGAWGVFYQRVRDDDPLVGAG
jgi:DegV family protein with EDD domain